MVFRKGGQIATGEKWFYEGTEIEIVNRYKYLGYTLTTTLSMNLACEEYAGRAKGKILDLMKTMWSLGNLDACVFFQLFDAQIKPMLMYASEIWGIMRNSVIESAHLFACKTLLSINVKSSNYMVYGETGRYPLFIESTISCIKYWLKLNTMPNTRFPKQALMMMQNCINSNSKVAGWLQGIKDCLVSHGFQDVWSQGRIQNEKAFLLSLKVKMIAEFKQEWERKITSSERFTVYRTFKHNHQPERYLNDLLIKKFRDSLIRLRLGLNELGINKRYQQEIPNNHMCPFCHNTLED
eukprot:TRINITY_DN27645_c0_g1_i3.p1 TRINITY_DN27645_c0_g1~~TRINITY_DN27645_c0_g1_i3.p1  ORF type:complete len:295 (+),score=15.40 TRINITY_DN27645_c0_g1_i3:814-1698(+)